jgi:hypothetical protein
LSTGRIRDASEAACLAAATALTAVAVGPRAGVLGDSLAAGSKRPLDPLSSPSKRAAGDPAGNLALARAAAAATGPPCLEPVVPVSDAHAPLEVLAEFRYSDERRWWPKFDVSVEAGLLAYGTRSGRVVVFHLDSERGERSLTMPNADATRQEIIAVAFSPGARCAVVSRAVVVVLVGDG